MCSKLLVLFLLLFCFSVEAGFCEDAVTPAIKESLESEQQKILSNMSVELQTLRVWFRIVVASSGSMSELLPRFEQRIKDYEQTLTDLETSNDSLKKQRDEYLQALMLLKKEFADLKKDFQAYQRADDLGFWSRAVTGFGVGIAAAGVYDIAQGRPAEGALKLGIGGAAVAFGWWMNTW